MPLRIQAYVLLNIVGMIVGLGVLAFEASEHATLLVRLLCAVVPTLFLISLILQIRDAQKVKVKLYVRIVHYQSRRTDDKPHEYNQEQIRWVKMIPQEGV